MARLYAQSIPACLQHWGDSPLYHYWRRCCRRSAAVFDVRLGGRPFRPPFYGHGDGHLAHGEAYAASWGGLSFGEVPKVLSLSMLVFFGWSSSLLGLYLYPPLADIASRAMWIGAGLSAIAFAPGFRRHRARGAADQQASDRRRRTHPARPDRQAVHRAHPAGRRRLRPGRGRPCQQPGAGARAFRPRFPLRPAGRDLRLRRRQGNLPDRPLRSRNPDHRHPRPRSGDPHPRPLPNPRASTTPSAARRGEKA